VKGSEFLRRVKDLADRNRSPCQFVARHGKGSHGMLFLGSRRTTLKDLKKEIGEGLLNEMCRQLGIRKQDLF
jgi:mRNA interferase HicA